VNDRLLTIGELARRTGVPVRTIRFWSDLGILPPAGRTAAGYRLYDAEAPARIGLVRTLRELGIDLATVQRILARQATIAEVARAHAAALDAEIRVLRLRRAVLRLVAERGGTTEELRLMHELARLSAEERQRIIDDFVGEVFAGIDPEAPGARIAQAMRRLPDLPEDPAPEQVDAWVELARLVADPGCRRRVREMALAGAAGGGEGGPGLDPQAVLEQAGAALAEGVAPDSARAREIVDRLTGPGLTPDDRARLADRIETFTDRRVERYWRLLGVLSGAPPFPSAVPAYEWLIAALRAPR